jgi:ubiquinone biosynthesis monooxygenase Coq7
MIRVDHAGEYGAKRIYAGQLAVLGRDRSTRKDANAVRHMAAQEDEHFAAFDALMRQRRVRPTALQPIWHVAGYALGAATALMGPKAAMACTAAVEDAIDAHYIAQTERLDDSESALRDLIEKARADENAHRAEALSRGAEEAVGYGVLSAAIKFGCRIAIALSERI